MARRVRSSKGSRRLSRVADVWRRGTAPPPHREPYWPAVATASEIEPWAALLESGSAEGRVVAESTYAARAARLVSLPADLNPGVTQALTKVGIAGLYAHQEEALRAIFDGPTIITTGTASGKSLCFQLPTLEVLSGDPRARALYLYPTKALAQDQARSLTSFGLTRQIRPAIYDGDTPRSERSAIRKRSNVVLTNPDMLHVGILPHHHS